MKLILLVESHFPLPFSPILHLIIKGGAGCPPGGGGWGVGERIMLLKSTLFPFSFSYVPIHVTNRIDKLQQESL